MRSPDTNLVSPQIRFQVGIEKLVYGGDGLARREGRVLLAPYVLPGETVEIAETVARGGVLRAAAPRIVSPAEGRVEPPCPYFARCGGCHYQHAGYDLQTALKESILRETLRRVGRIDAREIQVVSGEPWGYRNRARSG
jgi:23S rRNA (uracil1939-C5)-methyltransferase